MIVSAPYHSVEETFSGGFRAPFTSSLTKTIWDITLDHPVVLASSLDDFLGTTYVSMISFMNGTLFYGNVKTSQDGGMKPNIFEEGEQQRSLMSPSDILRSQPNATVVETVSTFQPPPSPTVLSIFSGEIITISTMSATPTPDRTPRIINTYDLVTPGGLQFLRVNGSTLINEESPGLVPTSPFPYSRLAVTNQTFRPGYYSEPDDVYYLCHQINETTFAEDQFDPVAGVWLSINITTKA